MTKNYRQGDIVWINFSPSLGEEMRGPHPAVIISSNSYNRKTNYIVVCPITSHGNNFRGYLPLTDYDVHGRINTTQLHSYSLKRLTSVEPVDHLRMTDLLMVMQMLHFIFKIEE